MPIANDLFCGPYAKIRVLVADDHDRLRKQLVELLGRQPDIEVVGSAGDGQAAVELALVTRPDVVVMDVSMPHCNGIAATRGILAELPGVKVIGLSMHGAEGVAQMMLSAGAAAYVPKEGQIDRLAGVIRKVMGGTSSVTGGRAKS